MGSQTTKFLIPYPVGTDRVMDGDNAMQAIAERLETILSASVFSSPVIYKANVVDAGEASRVYRGPGGICVLQYYFQTNAAITTAFSVPNGYKPVKTLRDIGTRATPSTVNSVTLQQASGDFMFEGFVTTVGMVFFGTMQYFTNDAMP